MASPFITGPLVPVGILNLIRASLGILSDSTFPENALATRFGSFLAFSTMVEKLGEIAERAFRGYWIRLLRMPVTPRRRCRPWPLRSCATGTYGMSASTALGHEPTL